MREILKLGGKLLAISAVAALALGVTNEITKGPIADQQIQAAESARREVLPMAASFETVEGAKDGGLDEVYCGIGADNQVCGYTGKITVTGYGGPIEVTVGTDETGTITGVSVGGSDFSETAGLGAKTKDEAFRNGFLGLGAADSEQIKVKQDGGQVDAVTSATISSRAVTKGVRTVVEFITSNCMTEGK